MGIILGTGLQLECERIDDNMRKIVTMADIGKKLGVSTVTVSKALSDKAGVSEEIREQIKDLALKMGYRYNSTDRSQDSRTNNIGVIIPERFIKIGDSYYWEFYKKIADELSKINNYAIFEILKLTDEQHAAIPKMVLDRKVDGVILLGQVNKKYFNMMKALPIPAVFMDFYENDITQDFIISDNFYSMYLLTHHVVEMGHKEIGFIGNKKATTSIQDRYLGYMKALIENDIEYETCSRWYISDRDEDGVYTDYELPETLPTAFVCNCDKMAYELIHKLEQRGLKVPEDISVVGFDNYIPPNEAGEGLTTAEVDSRAMAQAGVEVLMKRIHNSKARKSIRQISCKIILRNSVKKV